MIGPLLEQGLPALGLEPRRGQWNGWTGTPSCCWRKTR